MNHIVNFTAEDGSLWARCSCGWYHRWTPYAEIAAVSYSWILDTGLRHSLQGEDLPSRSQHRPPLRHDPLALS